MPPFREGPVKIDRKLSGEALKFLREVGHGHAINIVDASYDIPDGSRVIEFPGTSAEAYEAIIRLIPIENENKGNLSIAIMDYDPELADEIESSMNHVGAQAINAFRKAGDNLHDDKVGGENPDWAELNLVPRLDEHNIRDDEGGFYTMANNPDEPHTFIRTTDDLPFACASLVVGHSQRTE